MNREIKFRGKTKSTNEWIYGSLVVLKNDGVPNYFIIKDYFDMTEIVEFANEFDEPSIKLEGLFIEVIPETVGHYIGIRDVNGKEIYEGDILSWKFNGMRREYLIIEDIFTTWRKALEFEKRMIGRWELPSICEIVGNIYDNPAPVLNEV